MKGNSVALSGLKGVGGIRFRGLTPPGQTLPALRACLEAGLRRKDIIHKRKRWSYFEN